MQRRCTPAITLAALLVVASCVSDGPPVDRRVGDLSDRTWGGLAGKPPRISASGRQVYFPDFAGRFVWADYAAPWCSVCSNQRPALNQAERRLGDDLVFLTVMTSDMGGYGDPATQATARDWASRHGLDPDRVVAADLTAIRIPRHVLFSPEGQMLFEHTGQLTAAAIRETFREHRETWRARRR